MAPHTDPARKHTEQKQCYKIIQKEKVKHHNKAKKLANENTILPFV